MSGPSAERWQRIQSIFDAVIDLDPAARKLYIAAACVNDPSMRAEIERLLQADEAAGNSQFLTDIVRDAAVELADELPRTGSRVGPYRVVKELGRGGMGAVYLGERADDAYAGRVAIKFVRGASGDADLLRRFRAERQILADLRHPGIPRLLDAGESDEGTPFLVMEYIEGEPITAHARRLGLSVRERLRLFLAVCDAVAHAHRSLIVHRDIKPSNVLVEHDGTTRLVDFGIAKPLGPDFTAETTTVFRRLTPAHASPEQLRGERITVATDVYALGLLLYELVSGVQPFMIDEADAGEIQRRVLEEEVPAPSAVAAARGDPSRPALPRALAGDVDAITLTALRKEPDRRYASVEQLAGDVRRALDHAPVLARGSQPGYRAARIVGRYRAPIAAAAAVLIVVGILGAVSIARLAAARAQEQERRIAAEQVTRDLVGLLGTGAEPVGPGAAESAAVLEALARLRLARDRPADAREAAARAVAIRAAAGDPIAHAAALELLAATLRASGDAAAADSVVARAAALRAP